MVSGKIHSLFLALSFENEKKSGIFFVFYSLIRNFAGRYGIYVTRGLR